MVINRATSYTSPMKRGQKVKVTENGGIYAGKEGVVIDPIHYTKVQGMYCPPDLNKEVCIHLDNGQIIYMFKNRVKVI